MLKNIIYILLPLVIGCAKIDSYTWVQTLPQPWKLSEKELGSYLLKFQSRFPDYKNRLVFVDVITDQTENVYPMIVSGKGHHEMHLAPSVNEETELA